MPTSRKIQKITSPYGQRGKIFHAGIDLRSVNFQTGADLDILAPEKCKVKRQGKDGYGNYFLIVEPIDSALYGYTEIKFIHIAPTFFGIGAIMEKGANIGRAIIGGNSTQKHLHFETWKELGHSDPVEYFNCMGIKYE